MDLAGETVPAEMTSQGSVHPLCSDPQVVLVVFWWLNSEDGRVFSVQR